MAGELRRSTRASAPKTPMKEASVDSEDESGDEEDFVVQKQKQPKSRPSAASGRSKPKKTPVARATVDMSMGGDEDSTLFAIARSHGNAIAMAVKEWVDRYQQNRTEAMAELLTFLFKSCGSLADITADEVSEDDVDKFVKAFDDGVREDGGEDPFTAKGKGPKNFRNNFIEIWDKLARDTFSAEVLFDRYLMDKLLDFLIAISGRQIRLFRYAATLASSQLVTSWIRVVKSLGDTLNTTQRQLTTEQKKSKGSASERVRNLKKNLDATHKKVTQMEDLMRRVFQGIFSHRFRDTDPNIRAVTIEGLGLWIKTYPSFFLKDTYLKYLGWSLHDKDPTVRYKSASAIEVLYAEDENSSPMDLFTQHFSARFKSLINDVDLHVAVKGVEICAHLVRLEYMDEGEMSAAYPILVDESHQLRSAVATLVGSLMEASTQQRGTGSKKSSKKTEAHMQLESLLDTMSKFGGAPELYAYAVDALFEVCPVLQRWQLIADALLADRKGEALAKGQRETLVRVLQLAARKATGGRVVPEKHDTKRQPTKAQRDAANRASTELTGVMIKALPELLRKHKMEAAEVAPLLDMVPDLKLDMFALKKQDKAFKGLLELVRDVVLVHEDEGALDAAARTLVFCAREGPEGLRDVSQHVLGGLQADLVASLKSAGKAVAKLKAVDAKDVDHPDVFALRSSLLRLYRLQHLGADASSQAGLHDTLVGIVEGHASGKKQVEEQVVSLAVCNLMDGVIYGLHQLDPGSPDEGALGELSSRVGALGKLLDRLYARAEQGGEKGVMGAAFRAQADLFLVFSAEKYRGTHLEPVSFAPTEESLRRLWAHVEGLLGAPDGEAAGDEAVEAMVFTARLAAYQSTQAHWLAAEVVSRFVSHGRRVSDLVKGVCAVLKRGDPDGMWEVYLDAMKVAYERAEEAGTAGQADDCLDDVQGLAARIAQVYGGLHPGRASACAKIVRGGVEYGLRGAPARAKFLELAVAPFVSKIEPSEAGAVAASAEERAASARPSEGDDEWGPYFALLEQLRDRQEGGTGAAPHAEPKRKAKKPAVSHRGADAASEDGGEEEAADDIEEDGDEMEEEQSPPPASAGRKRERMQSMFADDEDGDEDEDEDEGTDDDEGLMVDAGALRRGKGRSSQGRQTQQTQDSEPAAAPRYTKRRR